MGVGSNAAELLLPYGSDGAAFLGSFNDMARNKAELLTYFNESLTIIRFSHVAGRKRCALRDGRRLCFGDTKRVRKSQ